MINTRWGSELAQPIIWGLLGRGRGRHLPFGQLAVEGTGRLGGAGRRWAQSVTAPTLTQQSSGPAPADWAPFPDVHSGPSLKPLVGLAAESRDGNQIQLSCFMKKKDLSMKGRQEPFMQGDFHRTGDSGGGWAGRTGALGASQSPTVCGGRCKCQAVSRVLTWQRDLLEKTLKESPHVTLDGSQVGGLKAEPKSSLQLASSTLSFSSGRKLREVKVAPQG